MSACTHCLAIEAGGSGFGGLCTRCGVARVGDIGRFERLRCPWWARPIVRLIHRLEDWTRR